MKNDGFAEVIDNRPSGLNICVIINHYEGYPEIWDTFDTLEDAIQEAKTWNSGMLGDKRNER